MPLCLLPSLGPYPAQGRHHFLLIRLPRRGAFFFFVAFSQTILSTPSPVSSAAIPSPVASAPPFRHRPTLPVLPPARTPASGVLRPSGHAPQPLDSGKLPRSCRAGGEGGGGWGRVLLGPGRRLAGPRAVGGAAGWVSGSWVASGHSSPLPLRPWLRRPESSDSGSGIMSDKRPSAEAQARRLPDSFTGEPCAPGEALGVTRRPLTFSRTSLSPKVPGRSRMFLSRATAAQNRGFPTRTLRMTSPTSRAGGQV